MYYYPTAEPCVVKDTAIQVHRQLASDGEITVEVGQRVMADEVVAIGQGAAYPLVVDAAGELNVAPADIVRGLNHAAGTTVKAGEVLVSVRAGLRRKELRAREDGILVAVDPSTGQLRFQSNAARYELKAHVAGVVEAIEGRRLVTISATVTRIAGIWGIGGETVGVLRVVTPGDSDDLRPEMIDARASLAVLVASRGATADALKKAATVGVKAVILGSIDEVNLRGFLDGIGRSEVRWYVGGPDWQLPSPQPLLPFTLIVTEGFGHVPMANEALATLRECEGREVAITGNTRLRYHLERPEIIIAQPGRAENRSANGQALLAMGTRVRIVEPYRLGQVGIVLTPPALRPGGDSVLCEMVDVQIVGGDRCAIPITNLEALL